jgi:hypothetical protein
MVGKIFSTFSISPFMAALQRVMIGAITKETKALLRSDPSSALLKFFHDFALAS